MQHRNWILLLLILCTFEIGTGTLQLQKVNQECSEYILLSKPLLTQNLKLPIQYFETTNISCPENLCKYFNESFMTVKCWSLGINNFEQQQWCCGPLPKIDKSDVGYNILQYDTNLCLIMYQKNTSLE